MNVLVTGAGGFIGHALCRELAASGHKVRAAVRQLNGAGFDQPSLHGIKFVEIGDIASLAEERMALEGVDAVVHLAAITGDRSGRGATTLEEYRRANVRGTEQLARMALRAGVRRFVYASTAQIYGTVTEMGRACTEDDRPDPRGNYAISKWEAEQALQRVAAETGMEVVVVRLPLVYGPGVKGNFLRLQKWVEKGIPLPLASITNSRSLIHLGNLVDALRVCMEHPKAAGQTYLVNDGEDISTPELIRGIARASGMSARLFPCPTSVLKMLGAALGQGPALERLLGSFVADSGKIRRELGWQPPYTLQQGLRETVNWYIKRSPDVAQ
ncbi:MAG: NAD-dependent epimerase/dehydratase family protein [Gammaproteobacteria bacterium]